MRALVLVNFTPVKFEVVDPGQKGNNYIIPHFNSRFGAEIVTPGLSDHSVRELTLFPFEN